MEVNTSSITDPTNMYNYMNQFVADPTILIVACLVILVFAVFFSSLGNDASSSISANSTDMLSSSSGNSIGYIIAFVLIMLIVFHATQYFFSINVRAFFTNLFTLKPELDVVIDQTKFEPSVVPEIKLKKQVYNIPGNYYDYTNAKALCNAYGSRLASYKEVESAYKKGGEWCNYGWSEGQMALFPTQQTTFDNLQKIKGHEHDCGRPGVNGGYIDNKNVRFGVNCYGYKPKMTSEEEEMMKNTTPYPITEEDVKFQKQTDFWKTKIDDILVSPFNSDKWSDTPF
jgi:hypothetical protein